jgi:hypothetical protein
MPLRLRRALPLVALAAMAVGGCETTTSPPPPPAVDPVTKTFSGTLAVNGAAVHTFTPTEIGEINVTLKVLAPVSTVTIGMGLGVWTGTSCDVLIADDEAILNELLIGTATGVAEYCARLNDAAGQLTAPTDYTIEVRHF